MDEEKKIKLEKEIPGESTWTFSSGKSPAGNSATACCFTDRESSILSEFGWNLPPDGGGRDDGGLELFNPFFPLEEASDSRTGGLLLPGNRTQPRFPAVPSPEIGRSGEENPSVSSCSSEEPPARPPESDGIATPDIPYKGTENKKQMRWRHPRVAFMTRSEVDHLEDGYRWRKYGQKGVKNSPFPRSYYRCTNSKCMVKKRVERCYNDPTVVVTTYEGQHCHQITLPTFSRGRCTRPTSTDPIDHEPAASSSGAQGQPLYYFSTVQYLQPPHKLPLAQPPGHWPAPHDDPAENFSLPQRPAAVPTNEGLLDDMLLPQKYAKQMMICNQNI